MDASFANIGGAKAGIVYDFYRGDVTSIYGSLDAYLASKVTVSADYDYYVPSFDGDSIWNFFAGEPTNDVGLRANVDVDDRLSVAGGGARTRLQRTDGRVQPDVHRRRTARRRRTTTRQPTLLPDQRAPVRRGRQHLGAVADGRDHARACEARGDFGDEGDRVGADLNGEHVFETRYVASARTGVWQWDDKLQPDRSTTSFNYVLGRRLSVRAALAGDGRVGARHQRPRRAAFPAHVLAHAGGGQMSR